MRWSYRLIKGEGKVLSVAISSDGEFIVAGGSDHLVYFFNKESKLLWRFKTKGTVNSVSISSNGELIGVASEDHNVYLLDRLGRRLQVYEMNGRVTGISMTSDGSLITIGSNRRVYLIDREGDILWERESDDFIDKVAISTGGTIIAAIGYSDRMYPIESCLKDRDGNTLFFQDVVQATQGRVYLFDNKGKLLGEHRVPLELRSIGISDDGDLLIGSPSDSRTYLLDIQGNLLMEYYLGGPSAISVAPDGGMFILGFHDYNIYGVDRSGALLWNIEAPGPVNSISFAFNRGFIAVGAGNNIMFSEAIAPFIVDFKESLSSFIGNKDRTQLDHIMDASTKLSSSMIKSIVKGAPINRGLKPEKILYSLASLYERAGIIQKATALYKHAKNIKSS